MPRLLLIRHGTTKLHTGDRFWGKTDMPLSDVGIKQVKQLHSRLAKEKINACFSSTLSRALTTAEIIAEGHIIKVVACNKLDECDFGDGTARDFPGGESLKQLNARVKVFMKRLEALKPDATAVIVSHGGPLRLLICNLLGIDIKHWQQIRINRASLSIIETYPQTAFLSLLNDISHLKS
jgi:broad specificity phosphatase PhoE